jgi:hypothetical protein
MQAYRLQWMISVLVLNKLKERNMRLPFSTYRIDKWILCYQRMCFDC